MFITLIIAVGSLVTGKRSQGFDLGPAKSDIASPTARHRCDISSKLCCAAAEMPPAISYTFRRNIASTEGKGTGQRVQAHIV